MSEVNAIYRGQMNIFFVAKGSSYFIPLSSLMAKFRLPGWDLAHVANYSSISLYIAVKRYRFVHIALYADPQL